jgi:hypothetical protein
MPKIGDYNMQKLKFRFLHGIVANKIFSLECQNMEHVPNFDTNIGTAK